MPLLTLEHVRLRPKGNTVSIGFEPGEMTCVIGPAAAGKTKFLRTLSGDENPSSGAIHRAADVVLAGPESFSRRARPQTLIPKGREQGYASLATEVLTALGLWEVRASALGELSPSQLAACECIPALAGSARVLLFDGQFDRLDPWTFDSAFTLLRQRVLAGATAVVATNRAEIVERFDALIAIKDGEPRFAGTIAELLRNGPVHEIEVITQYVPGARALVAPFEVTIQETEGGLRMEASQGQEVAARLLQQGFGDVRCIVVRQPSAEEAVLGILRGEGVRLGL